jgi:type VI protein secretion system component VasK
MGDMPESVRKLIEAPITYADALLGRLGPQDLNAKGKALCTEIHPLFTKYPFNPKSQIKATLDDVSTVFRPQQGILWVFYDQTLKKLLPKRGNEYVPDPANSITITRGFLIFFNNSAAFSNAIYGNGADPKLSYSMKPILSQDIQSAKLSINGTAADYSGPSTAAKQFTWPGDASGVRLSLKEGGTDFVYPTWDGLWGVFSFFLEADSSNETQAGGVYEWRLRGGSNSRPVTGSKGQPIVSGFDLDMGSAPHVFRKGFFTQMGCVPEIAK